MTEPLQFDAAEPAGTAAAPLACSNCKSRIGESYHMLNQAVLCERCRRTLQREWESGSGAGRFGRALLFGTGAAILGSLIYFAVLALTGYEVGLIAIVVGWLVGRAVKKGSHERGGRKYQVLAIGLTYLAIVSTYVPFIIKEIATNPAVAAAAGDSTATVKDSSAAALPADTLRAALAATDSAPKGAAAGGGVTAGQVVLALVLVLALAAASPVLAGIQNIIGMLIIGFALYQAWIMNRKVVLTFSGPFKVGAPVA